MNIDLVLHRAAQSAGSGADPDAAPADAARLRLHVTALVPVLTGMAVLLTGALSGALALPAACYALVTGFGCYARR